MTIRSPFMPHQGSNQVVSPAASSAAITIGRGDKTIRVMNSGVTNIMYFRTGLASDGTVVATTADVAVLPNTVVFICKPTDHDTVATISASGTTANIMSGEGGF